MSVPNFGDDDMNNSGRFFLDNFVKYDSLLRPTIGLLLCAVMALLPLKAQKAEVYNVHLMPDNSVVYALPITKIYIQVSFDAIDESPGDLALYAQRYLGVNNAILKPSKRYKLKGVRVGSYGVPDEQLRFAVKFGRRHDATNVTLSPDGLLLGINSPEAEVEPFPEDKITHPDPENRVGELGVLPPEYIQATTIAKKAEIAANEIYRLRESRTSIISGQSEQPFTDGKGMELAINRLDEAERVLAEHFIGKREITAIEKVISEVDISQEGKFVVFRFSEHDGLLPADDLRGEPIYLDIKIDEQAPELDEKEQKKLERHLRNGIVFRVPGFVQASLIWQGDVITSTKMAVAQLGTLEVLESSLFTSKTPTTFIEFYSSTGAIKRVRNDE